MCISLRVIKQSLKPESAGGAHRHSCDFTALRLRFYGVQHGSDFPHLSCVTIGGSEEIAQKKLEIVFVEH